MELHRMLFKPLPALLTSRFSDMFPRGSEWGVCWDESINVISVSSPVIFPSFCFSENFVLFSDVNVPPEISVLLICFEKPRHRWLLLSASPRDYEPRASSSKLNLPQFLGLEFSRWCFCFSWTLRNSSQQVSVSGVFITAPTSARGCTHVLSCFREAGGLSERLSFACVELGIISNQQQLNY